MNSKQMMRRLALGAAVCLLAACASQPQSLYHWGKYTENVYDYFKTEQGDGSGKGVGAMEKYLDEAAAKNQKAAPGAHAHLGMLYLHEGNQVNAEAQFAREKQLFPESGKYIDFLLKKRTAKGGATR